MGYLVLSKPGCRWCGEAEALLASLHLEYEVRELASGDELRAELRRLGHGAAAGRAQTFPQILDGERYVGGFEQLRELIDEPLLRPEPSRRFTPFPIRYHDMWEMYRKAVTSFWTAEEINMSDDVVDWKTKLTDDERHFIKHVLAFFACSDGIVMENCQANFSVDVQIPEARQFYAYQAFNEAVHAQTYGMLIDTLVDDADEREKLFASMETVPAVRAKATWATEWLNPSRRFAERLLAFVCVEGILFSGSFCAIFWLKQRGLMPGLGLSNQFISRDEGLHQGFGTLMYSYLKHKLTQAEAEVIVREAVDNEKAFIVDAIPCRLVGMNSDLMAQYIEFVADRLMRSLGYAAIYGASNPFSWMELISLSSVDNFFERFSSEYQRAGVMADAAEQCFGLDADF